MKRIVRVYSLIRGIHGSRAWGQQSWVWAALILQKMAERLAIRRAKAAGGCRLAKGRGANPPTIPAESMESAGCFPLRQDLDTDVHLAGLSVWTLGAYAPSPRDSQTALSRGLLSPPKLSAHGERL